MNEPQETPSPSGQVPSTAYPSNYPVELEQYFTLRNGRRIFIRPVIPADELVLEREVREADPETLYQRFFTAQPRLDAKRRHSLVHVDYQWRLALVAFAEDAQAVGIGRYVRCAQSGAGGNRLRGKTGLAAGRAGEQAIATAGRGGAGAGHPALDCVVSLGQSRHGRPIGPIRFRSTTSQCRRRHCRENTLIRVFDRWSAGYNHADQCSDQRMLNRPLIQPHSRKRHA